MEKNLLILAGDGIGPEVMDQVVRVIDWFNNNKKLNRQKITKNFMWQKWR